MKIAFKIVAFLMLALWLPASQHCDLEAAGITILTHGDSDSSSCREVSTSEACHTIEGVSYGRTLSDVRVLPPPASSICHLLSLLAAPAVAEREPVCRAGDPPEIQVLHRTWHFVRRTALPARAPDLVA